MTMPHLWIDAVQGRENGISSANRQETIPKNDGTFVSPEHLIFWAEVNFMEATAKMGTRFVTLIDRNGNPVCAPLPVSLGQLNYVPTDIDFEEAALNAAIEDGLVASRHDVIAAVRAERYARH